MLVLLVLACSTAVTATIDDDGGSVELAVGDTLELALPGNPTTGYDWHMGAVDEAVLRQVGETTFEPQSELLGAPGLVHLRFTAVGEGSTALELVYRRSFEDGSPLERFVLEVEVT